MSATLNALTFAKRIEGKFKGKALPKTAQEKQQLNSSIQDVAKQALSHFQQCQNEKSPRARSEAYRELTRSLNVAAKHLDDSKDWISYLLSFFWYCPAERRLRETIRTCFEAQITSQAEYLFSWLPSRSKNEFSQHCGWKIYERWGVKILSRFQWNPFDSFIQSVDKHVNESLQFRVRSLQQKYFIDPKVRPDLEGQLKAGAYRALGAHSISRCQINESGNFIDLKILQEDFQDFTRIFSDYFSPEEKTRIEKSLRELDFTLSISEKMNQARTLYNNSQVKILDENHPARKEFSSRIWDISFQVCKNIDLLAPTQSILIPGGYIHPQFQIPVFYKFTRVNSSEFRFQLITTARGVSHFEETLRLPKTAHTTFSGHMQFAIYTWDNVKLEDVVDTDFIFRLVSPAVDPASSTIEFIRTMNFPKAKKVWRPTYPFFDRNTINLWVEDVLERPFYKLFELYSLMHGLGNLLALQQLPPEEQNFSFVHDNLKFEGINAINKILSLGHHHADTSMCNIIHLMKEKEEAIRQREKQCQSKIQEIRMHIKKLSEMQNPQKLPATFLQWHVGIEALKKEYCDATGQDPNQPLQLINSSNPIIREKWRLFYEAQIQFERSIAEYRNRFFSPQIFRVLQEGIAQIEKSIEELERLNKAVDKDKDLLRKMVAMLTTLHVLPENTSAS